MDPVTIIAVIGGLVTLVNAFMTKRAADAAAAAKRDKDAAAASLAEAQSIVDDIMNK